MKNINAIEAGEIVRTALSVSPLFKKMAIFTLLIGVVVKFCIPIILLSLTNKKNRPYSELDQKVKHLMDTMNATGLIKTVASCQGHYNKGPYIYFKAPTCLAGAIEKLLREASVSDDPRFQVMWIIKGEFNENYELVFVLHSHMLNKKFSSLWTPVFLGLFRKRIDAELLALADVIEQAIMLYAKKGDKLQATAMLIKDETVPEMNMRTKRPYRELDPKVKHLVDTMNATGLIKTISSCQGHSIFGKPPYVYFKAPTDFAATIEQLLREAAMADDLNQTEWIVEGCFNQNYELAFLLFAPKRHKNMHSLWAMAFLGLFRKRIDAELKCLTEVVEKAALLHARKSDKPQITTRSNEQDQSK